jgi:hypothetical protein
MMPTPTKSQIPKAKSDARPSGLGIKTLWLAVALGASGFNAAAWDYEGHYTVNELALATLPADFPAFALTPEAHDRIAYLAGEADRWRNETNLRNGTGLALGHASAPDHYMDLEDIQAYDLTPATLPPLRYDFVAAIVKARLAHPERFPAIDPARDSDHTRELSGFLPWAITEYYEKLQSGFSTLAALEKFGGTPVEITNARQIIVYVMGVMGHFVGDASQPLHTTKHFNGWVGDNPNHYTVEHTFHAWIDGGFFRKTGGIDEKKLAAKIHPAEKLAAAADPNGIFKTAVDFVVANNQLVEPLYKLEKDGKLAAEGNAGAEGRAFLEGQLVKSGQLLGSLWLTAWQTASEDTYLERELRQRATAPTTK